MPQPDKHHTYDVVIIGARIFGSSVAWWLTQMAVLNGKVLVVARPTYDLCGPPAIQAASASSSVQQLTCEWSRSGLNSFKKLPAGLWAMTRGGRIWRCKLWLSLTSLTRLSRKDAAAEPENPNGLGRAATRTPGRGSPAAYPF